MSNKHSNEKNSLNTQTDLSEKIKRLQTKPGYERKTIAHEKYPASTVNKRTHTRTPKEKKNRSPNYRKNHMTKNGEEAQRREKQNERTVPFDHFTYLFAFGCRCRLLDSGLGT